jgi:putative membrane protein
MPDPLTSGPTNAKPGLNPTRLASSCTQPALDQTTLAWIRTTLPVTTLGFGTIGFFRTLREMGPTPHDVHVHESAIRFGIALVVISTGVSVLVAISHGASLRRLGRNETPVLEQWPMSITLSLLLAIIGLVSLGLMFGVGRGAQG